MLRPPGEPIIDGVNHLLNGVDEVTDFWLLLNNYVQEVKGALGIHIAGPKGSAGGSVGPCPWGPGFPVGGLGWFPDVKTAQLETSDTISVLWCVHHSSFVPNLVGYRFSPALRPE